MFVIPNRAVGRREPVRRKAVTSLLMHDVRTVKYCLAHVMYCARSSGVLSLETRVIEGAAFSSVMITAINRLVKVVGMMRQVSRSGFTVCSLVIDML